MAQANRQARESLTAFTRTTTPDEPPAKHHELLCEALEAVERGDIPNLMVFMPPGSAKSKFCSHMFPAWYMGRNPTDNIICSSFATTMAERFGKKVRNTVDTSEFEDIFDVRMSHDTTAKGDWATTDGGEYYAAGVDAAVTSRRADLGVVDDPVKGRKEADSETIQENTWQWFLTEFKTRMKPGGKIVIIQTRWNEGDLSGRILPDDWNGESGWVKSPTLRDENEKPEQWYVLCLPGKARVDDVLGRKEGDVLWPEYLGPVIRQMMASLPPRDVAALYQQVPTADEGTFFKREWFKQYEPGEQAKHLNIYITSDYAVTEDAGDFTEHAVWGIDPLGDVWLLTGWYGQTASDEWIAQLITLIKKWKPFTCFGEKGQIRRAIEPYLKKEMLKNKAHCRLEWFNRSHKKEITARAFQGLAAMGKIHIPNTDYGERALDQMLKFSGGRYDDFVDAAALLGVALDEAHDGVIPDDHKGRKEDRWSDPWEDDDNEPINWKTG